MLAETLPWHIYYLGFSGTLPNITQIQLQINFVSFSWTGWFTCLYEAAGGEALDINANRNTSTAQLTSFDPAGFLNTIIGRGAFCTGGSVVLNGRGVLTVTGTGEGVFLRLI
jgi:hypothetical protein